MKRRIITIITNGIEHIVPCELDASTYHSHTATHTNTNSFTLLLSHHSYWPMSSAYSLHYRQLSLALSRSSTLSLILQSSHPSRVDVCSSISFRVSIFIFVWIDFGVCDVFFVTLRTYVCSNTHTHAQTHRCNDLSSTWSICSGATNSSNMLMYVLRCIIAHWCMRVCAREFVCGRRSAMRCAQKHREERHKGSFCWMVWLCCCPCVRRLVFLFLLCERLCMRATVTVRCVRACVCCFFGNTENRR